VERAATPTGDLADPNARRRLLLDLSRRRVRPGSGSSLGFLRNRTWSDPVVDLHGLRTPFVIVGAVATALYMPERDTKDIDILVRDRDAPALHQELRAAGYAQVGRLAIGGTSWQAPSGELDVIESGEPWVEGAIGSPEQSPTGLPVIALPYLVLMKLQASRTIDIGDMTRMLGAADEPTRERVRGVIRAHKPDALDDVESMIALGELELRSPERLPLS
jgi:hypothetical protein